MVRFLTAPEMVMELPNLFFNLHETAPTGWDLALQIRLIGISFLAFHYFTT